MPRHIELWAHQYLLPVMRCVGCGARAEDGLELGAMEIEGALLSGRYHCQVCRSVGSFALYLLLDKIESLMGSGRPETRVPPIEAVEIESLRSEMSRPDWWSAAKEGAPHES